MLRGLLLCVLIAMQQPTVQTHEIPTQLQGDWVVTRLIPTRTISCWGQREANQLIGTTIRYTADSLQWKNHIAQGVGVATRVWTREEFEKEYYGGPSDSQLDFKQLGILSGTAEIVTIHHAPADIAGGSIEIPGDWALLKSSDTIIVSVCNLYFEAHRVGLKTPAHP